MLADAAAQEAQLQATEKTLRRAIGAASNSETVATLSRYFKAFLRSEPLAKKHLRCTPRNLEANVLSKILAKHH